ncbi:hypothetical protein HYFRA_00001292 [Hymenoscyphus fraxineus]|uniref:Uncharacterized protein n=1 Tax=Hymenoscyphus fraxineus TaxID=746836 RepID=A0A9N9L5D5_9HELO|nr:hypothetical protein HYFRA_00001292 [Hymenoscyphus fraxineus]
MGNLNRWLDLKSMSLRSLVLWVYKNGLITIYSTSGESAGGGKALNQLGTLLHEMVHAFLATFTFWEPGAHGRVWSDILSILERSLRREVDFKLDCEVWNSVKCDMICGNWRCSEREMVCWGADKEDM